ncbi:MAG TPA: ATP synthase subunit I [Acidobacteriaceae bacterium]|nr:ATP synthase subunit I [Acidobacteriaceae bacterium]
MSPDPDPAPSIALNMTDEDFRDMLRRALRTVVILGLLLWLLFTVTMGWQTGLLALAGAVISYSGIREWRNLALTVFSKLDSQLPPRPMGRTLVTFFLRLAIVGAILYVSLKCLHGSVYALIAGIGLAVVALSIEAVRLLRD